MKKRKKSLRVIFVAAVINYSYLKLTRICVPTVVRGSLVHNPVLDDWICIISVRNLFARFAD
jgi:hypothetical protein